MTMMICTVSAVLQHWMYNYYIIGLQLTTHWTTELTVTTTHNPIFKDIPLPDGPIARDALLV